MTWFIPALVAPFCWIVCNYLDQYISRRHFPGRARAYLYFSMLCSLFWLAAIALAAPDVLDTGIAAALGVIAIGAVFIVSLYPYMVVLQTRDVSAVVPVFQSVPFFVLLLGYAFAGQHVALKDILAGALIIAGAAGCMWDYATRRFPLKSFLLILFASLLVAAYFVGIHDVAATWPWYKVLFWTLAARVLFGAVGLAGQRSDRTAALDAVRQSRGRAVGLTILEQGTAVAAQSLTVVAMTGAPSAYHVSLCNGLQPFYGLMAAIGLGALWPRHFASAKLDRILGLRFLWCCGVFGGLYLLLA